MAPTPPWRPLLEAQLAASPECSLYALATVDAGEARVRHLVHRGFTPTHLLLACTDARSAKTHELAAPVEIAWYFPSSRRQFRLRAHASLVPAKEALAPTTPPTLNPGTGTWEDARRDLFARISPALRATFARPPPGTLRETDGTGWPTEISAEGGTAEEAAHRRTAEANFALLAMRVFRAEMIDLAPTPHTRTRWTEEGGEWVREEVVP